MHNEVHTWIVREVHNSLPEAKPKYIGDQWSSEARKIWRGEDGAGLGRRLYNFKSGLYHNTFVITDQFSELIPFTYS